MNATVIHSLILRGCLWMTLPACGVAAGAQQTGVWKTAYVKQGFVGNYDANWAGGTGAALRMRVPMPFDGTKVRIYVRGCFDADPSKEALRQEINGWIRREAAADGVIDFDAALADPQQPVRMKADCQSDWVHPNDRGYGKMAEVAAQVLRPGIPRPSRLALSAAQMR